MPALLVPANNAATQAAMTAHWPRRRIAFKVIFYSS
jgi:hypothetical protein